MTLAVLTALAVIALRLVLHAIGSPAEGTDFMIVHFLAIATAVFFAQWRLLRGRRDEAGFPHLVRDGFKSAALYALIMLGFLWWYYKAIEPDYFSRRIEAMVFKAVEEGLPEAQARQRIMGFFTPFNYASISFFALLAAGLANSLVIGALQHKLLRRAMR